MPKDPLPAQSGGELKERLDAERRNQPFLLLRDQEGSQVIRELGDAERLAVGRGEEVGLHLDDPEVSSLHAELERIGGDWVLVDDGLSRNGSFVNGERVSGRRRLRDGDALRFGQKLVVFRAPGAAARGTVAAGDTPDAASITDTQRRILIALCRPYREGSDFATLGSNRQIAEEVFRRRGQGPSPDPVREVRRRRPAAEPEAGPPRRAGAAQRGDHAARPRGLSGS